MAKQGKVLPARRARDEEALLIRSAESLGRIIGSLQRQLESVGVRLTKTEGHETPAGRPGGHADGSARREVSAANGKPARNGARAAAGRRASGAAKAQSTESRTSKRASKSAAAKRTVAGKSGARKAARKSPRGR